MHHAVDLNLVRLFVAVYETRSVTRAAQRLFLTQPTVSYGLAKLRTLLNDPLFMRSKDGMAPTPCSERTYAQFRAAMAQIDGAIGMTRHFDPPTSKRRFRVALSDIGELFFLPLLLQRVQQEAPDVEVEVVQTSMDLVAGWLAAGKVDIAVGNLGALAAPTRHVKLFTERYVCLLRAGHPAIRRSLSIAQFANARHVLVSSPASGHALVEEALRAQGVARKIASQILHFTILPRLIASTDLLVTLPSRVATLFAEGGQLRILDLPVQIAPFDVRVYWDERQDADAAHSWFRALTIGALAGL